MALRNYLVVFVTVISVVFVTDWFLTTVYLSHSVGNGIRRPLWNATPSTGNHTRCLLASRTTTHTSSNCGEILFLQEKVLVDQQHSNLVTKEIRLTNQTNRTQGYLLARSYDQQMTAGVVDFFQLSNIAFRLNLSTVTPYVQGSHHNGDTRYHIETWRPQILEFE